MTKAIILLSGGLDSATNLALAHSKGRGLYVLSFDYGQRHEVELEYAKRWSRLIRSSSIRLRNWTSPFGGSSLTADMRSQRPLSRRNGGGYTKPASTRNTVFLSYALAWADVLKAVGICRRQCVGLRRLPDCRPEFVQAFQNVADVAFDGNRGHCSVSN